MGGRTRVRRVLVVVAALSMALATVVVAPADAKGKPQLTTINCGDVITTHIVVANDLLDCDTFPWLTVGRGARVDLNRRTIGTPRSPGAPGEWLGADYGCWGGEVLVEWGGELTNGRSWRDMSNCGGRISNMSIEASWVVNEGELVHSKLTQSGVISFNGTTIVGNRIDRGIYLDNTENGFTFKIRNNVFPNTQGPPPPWFSTGAEPSGWIFLYMFFGYFDLGGEIVGNRGGGVTAAGYPEFVAPILIAENTDFTVDYTGVIECPTSPGNPCTPDGDPTRHEPYVPGGGPVTLQNNVVSGDSYISLRGTAPTFVDGGGNIARGNAQCIGVICTKK
jgi:hypothetical protein